MGEMLRRYKESEAERQAEWDAIVAQRDALLVVVKALEWVQHSAPGGETYWLCHWCGAIFLSRESLEDLGHLPNCPRQTALALCKKGE